MARTIISSDGDMIDLIVWRATGGQSGAVEMVMDTNSAAIRAPPMLPAGVAIIIPDAALKPPERPVFKLWE